MLDIHKITNNIEQIADHYGNKHQEIKLIEEVGELMEEVSKSLLLGNPTQNLISEMADVNILISQLLYLYDKEEEYADELQYKLDRQVERIK